MKKRNIDLAFLSTERTLTAWRVEEAAFSSSVLSLQGGKSGEDQPVTPEALPGPGSSQPQESDAHQAHTYILT